MTDDTADLRRLDTARTLALINYGLLFAAIFFAGVPALIAAVIAYSQRDAAPALIRGHLNSQIRIFWVAFALTFAAGLCLLAAIGFGISLLVQQGGWDVNLGLSNLVRSAVAPGWALSLGLGFLSFSALSLGWLICAPAIGFIRLASQAGIGHSAAA